MTAVDVNAVAPESVSVGSTRELIDVLGGLLREMRAESFQVACDRAQAAAMFGLKPDSKLFGKIEKKLRKRQPSGASGKVLYSVQSIREYMGDVSMAKGRSDGERCEGAGDAVGVRLADDP